MKATPKLQDILEVFLEQIDGLESALKEMKNISPNLSAKINELKSIKIEPDLKNFQSLQSNHTANISGEINKLAELFGDNQVQLKAILHESKNKYTQFYLYILAAFLVTSGAIYFGVAGRKAEYQLNSQIENLKSYNKDLENYIKDSKQVEKYNKWIERSKSH